MATPGNGGASSNILEKLQKEFLGRSRNSENQIDKDTVGGPSDEMDMSNGSSPARESRDIAMDNDSSPAWENQKRQHGQVTLEESTSGSVRSDRELLLSLHNMQTQYMQKVQECVSSVKDIQNEWVSYQEAWNAPDQYEEGANFSNTEESVARVTASQPEREREGGASTSRAVTSPVMAAPMNEGIGVSESSPKTFIEQIANKFKVAEQSGPPVDKNVSDLVEGLLSTRLEEKQRSELFDRYLCPSNMQKVKPPRVNAGIWQTMSLDSRQRDTKSQKLQEIFLRGVVPLTSAVDKLNALSNQEVSKEELTSKLSCVVEEIVDGIALIASGSYELSIKRRDAIRQDLTADYKQLCAHSNPITEYLFGDDLPEMIKDLSETNKLVSKLAPPGRMLSMRGRGSPRGRGFRGRGRGVSFLDDSRGSPVRQHPYAHRGNMQQVHLQQRHHLSTPNPRGGRPRRR